jgi:putative DNA primase/helicase
MERRMGASMMNVTNRKGFNSQSEADLSLASQIAHALARKGVPVDQMAESIERIFDQSGLASREKWWDRNDYRERTIGKAIEGVINRAQVKQGQVIHARVENINHKDVRNAELFAKLYKGRFIFVSASNKWYSWDGSRWKLCELREEYEAAKQIGIKLLEESNEKLGRGDTSGEQLKREAISAHTLARIEAMVKLATSIPGMSVAPAELDADPYLLGVRNGVVDLNAGKLLPADPTMLLTKQCDADFVDDPTCPLWIKFLHEIFQHDKETIRTVQILLGYTLIGEVLDELLIICYGFGANGKSVFNNVITSILKDYAQAAPSSMLKARRSDDSSPRNDLAGIKGARYLSFNELQAGDRLDEQVIKAIAGREMISARFLFGEFFTYKPTFTGWVRTNHRPIITGDEDGIWRRIALIPFNRRFTTEEQDPQLEKKLLAERDGILGWILEGVREYLETGITLSPRIKAEVNAYRKESDVLGEFLEEKTRPAPLKKIEQQDLYWRYKHWCEINGLKHQSKKSFSQRLKERGYPEGKSGKNRYYVGLELQEGSVLDQRANFDIISNAAEVTS